jgi:predicted short-subunit dehydrogenase-like oxidoreductase (DUF2520 family)
MSAPTLNLIGAGRVGCTLARLWQAAGLVQVQAVLTRSAASAQAAVAAIGGGRAVTQMAEMPPAELWLLAVPDTAIAPMAQALAQLALPPALAWHASGFLPASTMQPLAQRGWQVASAHPALSFARVEVAAAQFPGTVCALEGDEPAVQRLAPLLGAIGGQCFRLAPQDKPLYHGAAVFASNFLPVLQAVATELWQGAGVPPERVQALAQGFVQRAAANVLALGPQGALTGPAARGDQAVLRAQGAAMAARDPALGAAYAALSEMAGRLAREGRVLGAAALTDGEAS